MAMPSDCGYENYKDLKALLSDPMMDQVLRKAGEEHLRYLLRSVARSDNEQKENLGEE